MTGRLYYPNATFVDTAGCSGNLRDDPGLPPNAVIMVDRGNCSFTAKVFWAQQAGAQAVLVRDSQWLCGYGNQCSSAQVRWHLAWLGMRSL